MRKTQVETSATDGLSGTSKSLSQKKFDKLFEKLSSFLSGSVCQVQDKFSLR